MHVKGSFVFHSRCEIKNHRKCVCWINIFISFRVEIFFPILFVTRVTELSWVQNNCSKFRCKDPNVSSTEISPGLCQFKLDAALSYPRDFLKLLDSFSLSFSLSVLTLSLSWIIFLTCSFLLSLFLTESLTSISFPFRPFLLFFLSLSEDII